MEYCLTGHLSIVLYQVVAFTAKHIFLVCHDLLCKLCCLGKCLILNLKNICIMLLWKDKCMSLCSRTCIEYYLEIIILVD